MPALRSQHSTSVQAQSQTGPSRVSRRGREMASSSKAFLSENGAPSTSKTNSSVVSSPERRPLGDRNVIPQVVIPFSHATALPKSLGAGKQATRDKRQATTVEAPSSTPSDPSARRTRASRPPSTNSDATAARQPLTRLGAVVERRTTRARSKASPTSAAVGQETQARSATRSCSTSSQHIFVDIPAAGQSSRRATRTLPVGSAKVSQLRSAEERNSASKESTPSIPAEGRYEISVDIPSPGQSRRRRPSRQEPLTAMVPDSDDLEYVDFDLAGVDPNGSASQALLSKKISPPLSHDSSDKENQPPASYEPRLGPSSGPGPQHSTPLAARIRQPFSKSTLPAEIAPLFDRRDDDDRGGELVLDDIFHMSSDGGPRSSPLAAPASRTQRQHAVYDAEGKLSEYQREGVAKVARWNKGQQQLARGRSEGAASIQGGVLADNSSLPAIEAIDRDTDKEGEAVQGPAADVTEVDDDPFGFFESEKKLKAKRAANLQARREKRRNQALHTPDDTKLARQAFASPTPSPPASEGHLVPENLETAERRSDERSLPESQLNVSVLPPMEDDLLRKTRSQTRAKETPAEPSSPLTPSPRKPPVTRKSTRASYAVIHGIAMKRGEVKEREMLERLTRKATSSSPDASSPAAGQSPKPKSKRLFKMDELVSLLPLRHAQQRGRTRKMLNPGTPPKGKRGKKRAPRRRSPTPEEDDEEQTGGEEADQENQVMRTQQDWRKIVNSSESRSSDSDRTKRLKTFRRLDKYSLESELVL